MTTPQRPEPVFNERSGNTWAELQAQTDTQLSPLGLRAMAQLPLRPGDRVLDVGCGCGQTLLQLAERVGPGGRVVGIDPMEPMLKVAAERARSFPQIEIVQADAATHEFPVASFDALFSRFGVMFFEDPVAAFRHLRRALRPGGHLAFVCWQAIENNPWAHEPLRAALRVLPDVPFPDTLKPGRPGAFQLADEAFIHSVLSDAGFDALRVTGERHSLHFMGAQTLDQAVQLAQRLGPASRLMDGAPPELEPALAAELTRALAPFATDRGVFIEGAIWVVTARAPAA